MNAAGHLRVAIEAEPDSLDPHRSHSRTGGAIMRNLFDPLVRIDRDGSFKPALATAWESAPDRKSMVFELRRDVRFHDGTPFNAAAVKFAYDRVVDPATRARMAIGYLGPYGGSEILDEYTVRISWREPYPFLTQLTPNAGTYLCFSSPTAVERYGDQYEWNPVGTGPYRLEEWVKGDHITIVRNPDYAWAPPLYDHPQPYLDRISFKIANDADERGALLERGEVDVVLGLPASWCAHFEGDARYRVLKKDIAGPGLLYVISTVWPGLEDLRVRQAMEYAVDRERIIRNVFYGQYTPSYGPLSEQTPCFDAQAAATYRYDPRRSRELLAEAGWHDADGDGFVERDGRRLSFPIWTLIDPALGLEMQAQFAEVGIAADTVFVDSLLSDVGLQRGEVSRSGNFGIMWLRLNDADPGILRVVWHSERNAGIGNSARFRNHELDQALALGGAATSWHERCPHYAKAQRILMDNAVMIPIYAAQQIMAFNERVRDLEPDQNNDWPPDFFNTYVAVTQ